MEDTWVLNIVLSDSYRIYIYAEIEDFIKIIFFSIHS